MGIYNSLKTEDDGNNTDYYVNMDSFTDKARAISILKKWIDIGAYSLITFKKDFTDLRIRRNINSDRYLQQIKDERKK